jgi:hypothetical protein
VTGIGNVGDVTDIRGFQLPIYFERPVKISGLILHAKSVDRTATNYLCFMIKAAMPVSHRVDTAPAIVSSVPLHVFSPSADHFSGELPSDNSQI